MQDKTCISLKSVHSKDLYQVTIPDCHFNCEAQKIVIMLVY